MAEELEQEFSRANLQIDEKIRKSVARYVDLEKRAKALNDEKKNEREQMEKLGIHPRAYQDEVRNFKLYDEAERTAYMASRRRMAEVLTVAEGDLFAEEIAARQERAAKKAKVTGKEGAIDSDTNPRSDPARGGAGRPTEAELTAAAAEQAEGEAVLEAAKPKAKRSQSAIAKEKLEAIGKLN